MTSHSYRPLDGGEVLVHGMDLEQYLGQKCLCGRPAFSSAPLFPCNNVTTQVICLRIRGNVRKWYLTLRGRICDVCDDCLPGYCDKCYEICGPIWERGRYDDEPLLPRPDKLR